MGYNDQFKMQGDPFVSNTGPMVGVFVSPDAIAATSGLADEFSRIMIVLHATLPLAPIPGDLTEGLSAAVVEVDPREGGSIERLTRFARSHPELAVIAAARSTDVGLMRTLMREGIADLITLPISVEELTHSTLDAMARRASPASAVRLAPLVVVARSSGGCGATTVATHLASELATRDWRDKSAVIVDLDLQFGAVATYLNVERGGSLPELVTARDRIDAHLIDSIAVKADDRLAVIGVPDEIVPIDVTDIDGSMAVVERLRRHFGLVVIDLPPEWSNLSASLAFTADLVLIVTEVSLNSVRQARRTIDLLTALDFSPDKIELVANKVEKRMFRSISLNDVSRTLGRDALAALPADPETLQQAQNQGILAGTLTRRSPFALAIKSLADTVEARLKTPRSQ